MKRRRDQSVISLAMVRSTPPAIPKAMGDHEAPVKSAIPYLPQQHEKAQARFVHGARRRPIGLRIAPKQRR
ncbi:MAG TPA: hypothetical protein PKY05_15510, partial [Fibrobacteria bacterium]|nr:hypothetical protein [Fibrobacteria bacterium]